MSENKTAKDFFQEGMSAFMDQNYEKSILALSRVIELDPDNRLAHMSRGAAFLKLNITDNAVADFTRAVEIDPDYARAFHLRGLAHEQDGNSDAALGDFNRAIGVDSEYGAAYYSRASLHSKMGNPDLAAGDIEMATHLTEVNIETFANENNIWRSHHMKLEETDVADTFDR
jgi:tetratricopeptide (TPR) repeat protein